MLFDDSKLYRFNDLQEMGLVPNWPTLRRWQEREGFPSGRLIGPNFRSWTGGELNQFLATRSTGPGTLKGAAKQHARCRP